MVDGKVDGWSRERRDALRIAIGVCTRKSIVERCGMAGWRWF